MMLVRRIGLMMLLFAAPAQQAAAAMTLEPYKMVRSLQLVQDRIAGGDHAALPMQRKLLEMIDARLLAAEPPLFEDDRNVDALLLYSMSGGNPETIRTVADRIDLDEAHRTLVRGLLEYLRGNPVTALGWLNEVGDASLRSDVAAFLSLVRGSLMSGEDAEDGLHLLDRARLLGPGTLVEEAALRRSVPVTATLGDGERFLRASSQYVRRFLGSPYASQFADSFVDAIVTLRETLDLDAVAPVVAHMSDEQAKVIYLRLARRAAIEGYADLLEFASRHVDELDGQADERDPRAVLYSSISSVTSENVVEVLARLDTIDRRGLSVRDKELLDAALSVASKVTDMPKIDAGTASDDSGASAPPSDAAGAAMTKPENTAASDGETKPVEMGLANGAQERRETDGTPAPEDGPDATQALAGDVRERLRSIDALLAEASQ